MAEINLDSDLTQVNTQIEDLVTQLNKLNADREQLTQSIHNLNGIAMYLRGKQQEGGEHVDEIVNEYPPDEVEKDD
ncbi:hypothetical protein CMI37_04295 [Candidatus Pacearchaeota archaeon]|nr:hypothetical protein [Candidatus Pacearchaeota archaeon]